MKKVTISKINQEKILEFMANVMSIVEGETFTVASADVCSSWYTLLPKNIVTGKVHIIANKEYMKKFELIKKTEYFSPFEEYSFVIGENDKVLLIKSRIQFDRDKKSKYNYAFKRSRAILPAEQKGYNFKRYPYLEVAMSILESNASRLNDSLDTAIEETLGTIEVNPFVLRRETPINPKVLEKNIFRQLNGIPKR